MKNIIYAFLVISVFASCEEDPMKEILIVETNLEMNLENLEVGQKFQYILFTAESYFDESNSSFQYTGDTLELEVISVNNSTYSISEKFTEGSAIHTNAGDYYWRDHTLEYINAWTLDNGLLTFTDNNNDLFLDSHLLYTQELVLDEFNEEEVEADGWKTTYEYIEHDTELFINDFDLNGNSYDRLNIYINNSDMAVDGPGNTTFYSGEFGIVRTSTYSWWTSEGIGWDRI